MLFGEMSVLGFHQLLMIEMKRAKIRHGREEAEGGTAKGQAAGCLKLLRALSQTCSGNNFSVFSKRASDKG